MASEDGWAERNLGQIRSSLRKLLGLVWGLDAALKFLPQTPFWFSERVLAASIGQPAWLGSWFAFWVRQSSASAALDVSLVAGLEFALAFALFTGFLRKIAYIGGIALSLLIWAVPEGFGGPYVPGTFDTGTGIVYALALLVFVALEVSPDSSRGTLDARIARRIPGWARWAEVVPQRRSSGDGGLGGG